MPARPLKTTLWLVLLAAAIGAAVYRDLLASAFATNPNAGSAQAAARGQQLWEQDCMPCHGHEGRGDGPATASLKKQPKDLTRIAPPPIFPDGVLAYRIANGGEVMPAWKSVLSDSEIWDLVSYIRSQHR